MIPRSLASAQFRSYLAIVMDIVNPTPPVTEKTLEDADLVRKVRKSDIEAFRVLFEKYQPTVYRDVFFRTRDAELSHDIVQDTFLRIWERRKTLRANLSILGFLLRISGNLARDAVRRGRTRDRLKESVPQPAISEGDDPEAALNLAVLEERLTAIINDRLPKRCRAIFLLSRFEGKSNNEIAMMLKISVRTVEHQIAHALGVLRRSL